ncbi:MAG: HAMP domain-containing protein [Deltaproteobacteria bacterium]|nr:HAMP domain-containing protein [Deltaproteobacteria bacterium]
MSTAKPATVKANSPAKPVARPVRPSGNVSPGVQAETEFRQRATLLLKLETLVVGILVLAVGSVAGVLLFQEKASIENAQEKSFLALSETVAKYAKESILIQDDLIMGDALDVFRSRPEVVGAFFIDHEARVLSALEINYAGERYFDPVTRQPFQVTDQPALTKILSTRQIWVPVSFKNRTIGGLVVLVNLEHQIRLAFVESARRVSLVALPIFILGVMLTMLVARLLVNPLSTLKSGIEIVGRGKLDYVTPVTTSDEIGAITHAFNRMAAKLLRKEQETNALGRYVSKGLLDQVLSNPTQLQLGGKSQAVTVMFVDIRGFTTMSEEMNPRDVVNILNKYFKLMAAIIGDELGTLDKFIGDCVMALFGAPIYFDDHAERAVRAALRIRDAVNAENVLRIEWGWKPVEVGIGINTAEVVVGNIGTEERYDYTAIGDGVNTAARLEGQARRGEIAISGSTYEKVKHLVDAEHAGDLQLKGKQQAVSVYKVTGIKAGIGALPEHVPTGTAGPSSS